MSEQVAGGPPVSKPSQKRETWGYLACPYFWLFHLTRYLRNFKPLFLRYENE